MICLFCGKKMNSTYIDMDSQFSEHKDELGRSICWMDVDLRITTLSFWCYGGGIKIPYYTHEIVDDFNLNAFETFNTDTAYLIGVNYEKG